MKDLKEQILESVRQDLVEIEVALTDNLKPYLPLVSHVAKYIMFSGGKRIRPLLMVLSARLCGYRGNYDKTLSVVFEYLHAATLLHDDLVDGADMRRGNPVAHSIWGNPATVLVGDFLLARSIAIAARTNSVPIIDILAHTTAQMSEGEIHQLLHRGDIAVDEKDYTEVITRKTAYLIQAACQVGALLAEAPVEQVQVLAGYGYHLGIAFQIADDLLDYTADTRVIGKTTGTDLREGKLTLPVIYALDCATREDRRRLETIIRDMVAVTPTPNGELLRDVDAKDADFETVLGLIKKYGGIAYTRDRAQEHIEQAKKCLEIFDASQARTLLEQLADYVVVRKM
ncbi:MAG: polyprenyl synthetase family protein [Deltaproteobacteria bacterium]|nr:polyprenyl synthetase family protein [Deltaproteobacteria bacterium]MBW1795208.1 polyprenyl synthetase family protein [Deltaproteobacteria bacterium]